ncbi:MAG: hypothetical protein IJF18_00030 [Oscillospiraceae bacterium]|nr:hypothetical protein [Oscillospiraceae bacterium]
MSDKVVLTDGISESDYELLELISKLSPEQKAVCKEAFTTALQEFHKSKVWALCAVTENNDI